MNRAPIGASRAVGAGLDGELGVLDLGRGLGRAILLALGEIGDERADGHGDDEDREPERAGPRSVARDERQREAHKRGAWAHAEESPPHAEEDGARDELRVDLFLQ